MDKFFVLFIFFSAYCCNSLAAVSEVCAELYSHDKAKNGQYLAAEVAKIENIQELLTNQELTLAKARDVLKRELSEDEMIAISAAHLYGFDEIGADGINFAHVGNYTFKQNLRKGLILKGVPTLTAAEIRLLIKNEVVGVKKSQQNRLKILLFPLISAAKAAYEALFKVQELVGIPWLMPAQFDQEIKTLLNQGSIEGATKRLIEVRMAPRSSASTDRILDQISMKNWLPSENGPAAAPVFRKILMPNRFMNIIGMLALVHESRHLVGGAGPLSWIKQYIIAMTRRWVPAGEIIIIPYRYFAERAAIGATWELMSRMSPYQRSQLISELKQRLQNISNNNDTRTISVLINSLQSADLIKPLFVAKIAHASNYGPISLTTSITLHSLFMPKELRKAGITAILYYFYPEYFTQAFHHLGFN